ncbi:MAG: CHASE2 domain-containing protein [Cyanothece sp. SIO1E1]|nr:CHASE2 domain-containing protein [Cyanothece sp. SIO1E1]
MTGVFNLLEWAMQDQWFRLRPAESVDNRIVIVTIGESDIDYVQQWPMPDQVMAQLIRNIRAQQPRVIGIDIYRDLPVAPGHAELQQVFQSTPNLIGIEKVAAEAVAPPPTLVELDQIAASDVLIDADGKIRRGLVSVRNAVGASLEGFGTKLARLYLAQEGIELEVIDADQKIYRLGQATFVPLSGREGQYSPVDMGGYQILINYRGDLPTFPTVSMQDVLENRIPPDLIDNAPDAAAPLRDRIVLLGATASSLKDVFQTPFSQRFFATTALTPGIVVHANLTSQILSGALGGRSMLRPTAKILNYLWILLWSGVSASLGSVYVSRRWLTQLGLILAITCIITSAYIAFLIGWLIPIFTPLLALVSAAVVSGGATLWQNLNLSYQKLEAYATTLEDKVKARTAELAQANQEITILNKKLQADNLRLSAELEVAHKLQQMVLPKDSELAAIQGLDIAVFMEPAAEVGGDYYDVLSHNDVTKISIGDVTGHGLESGVLMLMVQASVRVLQEYNLSDPVAFLDVLNRAVYNNVARMGLERNLTLAILDYQPGQLLISGQHEEIIIVRVDGQLECIDTIDLGFPIGLDTDITRFIAQEKVDLNPGDLVILYTDGITEAKDTQKDRYGLARLCEVVKLNRNLSAEGIKDAVIDDLKQHIGQQKIFDDISLLVLKQK